MTLVEVRSVEMGLVLIGWSSIGFWPSRLHFLRFLFQSAMQRWCFGGCARTIRDLVRIMVCILRKSDDRFTEVGE